VVKRLQRHLLLKQNLVQEELEKLAHHLHIHLLEESKERVRSQCISQ
jgi:hypothetical protein